MECTFENVDLSNANITATAFQNCIFSNSKMLGLDWGTVEKFGFHFQAENCNMEHNSFYKTSLKQCALTNCSLKNTDFVDADLLGCNLTGSNLDNAQFQNTNLEKADLRDCMNYSLDPESNNIKAAKFSLNQLPGLLNKFQIKVFN